METLRLIFAEMNMWAPLLAFILMAFDVISGIVKGASQKNISSKIMKRGFWHKLAILMAIFLAWLIDVGTQTGLNLGFNAPIFEGACVYVMMMEIVSIVENIVAINPELKGSKILGLFGSSATIEKEETHEETDGESRG